MSNPDPAVERLSGASAWAIEPLGQGWGWRIREIWRFRYLFNYFAVRTLTSMFRNTKLRPLWLTLRIAGPIGLGALVFGGVLNAPSEGLPYFLFFLGGTAPWAVFESGVMWVTRSLERNKSIVSRVYFPRLILPAAALSPALLELAVIVVALIGALGYYFWVDKRWYARTDAGLAVAVLTIATSLLFALGVGLWTSVLQARYRDVRYTLRYAMRFWFYFTPVAYPVSHIPEKWRWLAYLNPMTPVVELFKWGLLGVGQPSPLGLAGGGFVLLATLAGGLWFFVTTESDAVDRM